MKVVEIIDLTRYGDHGWAWTERVTDGDREMTRDYHTSRHGDGLWAYGIWGGDISPTWRQERGTCQYFVPYVRGSAFRILTSRAVAAHREL